MKGTFKERVTPLITSAMNSACFSLSITQGPAMRKRPPSPIRTPSTWKEIAMEESRRVLRGPSCPWWSILPVAHLLWPVEHFHLRGLFFRPPLQPMLIRRAHKRSKQRMRLQRLRLKLRMKLAADEVRVIGQLDHLDISSVRCGPGNPQARSRERVFVFAVEFITVPVALADLKLAIDPVRQGSRLDFARPRAQPHGAAQLFHATQLAQLIDHAMRRGGIELAGIGFGQPTHIP